MAFFCSGEEIVPNLPVLHLDCQKLLLPGKLQKANNQINIDSLLLLLSHLIYLLWDGKISVGAPRSVDNILIHIYKQALTEKKNLCVVFTPL